MEDKIIIWEMHDGSLFLKVGQKFPGSILKTPPTPKINLTPFNPRPFFRSRGQPPHRRFGRDDTNWLAVSLGDILIWYSWSGCASCSSLRWHHGSNANKIERRGRIWLRTTRRCNFFSNVYSVMIIVTRWQIDVVLFFETQFILFSKVVIRTINQTDNKM